MNPDAAHAAALGRQIVNREVAGEESAQGIADGVVTTFARLQALMATLIGPIGFEAVLARAIHITSLTYPWIDRSEVDVEAALSVSWLVASVERHGAEQVRAGVAALFGNVVVLLCAFIGESLTFRLIRRMWPNLSDLESSAGPEDTQTHE